MRDPYYMPTRSDVPVQIAMRPHDGNPFFTIEQTRRINALAMALAGPCIQQVPVKRRDV
jgi:hypothetical protein